MGILKLILIFNKTFMDPIPASDTGDGLVGQSANRITEAIHELSKLAKTLLRKPRLQISFQICSMGFISGVYGGIWNSSIFFGISRAPDLCHAAVQQKSKSATSELTDLLFS